MTATKACSKRNLRIGGAFVLALAALGACQSVFDRQADSAAGTGVIAPVFEVDPLWPKPLPHHWLLGMDCFVNVPELGRVRHHSATHTLEAQPEPSCRCAVKANVSWASITANPNIR